MFICLQATATTVGPSHISCGFVYVASKWGRDCNGSTMVDNIGVGVD